MFDIIGKAVSAIGGAITGILGAVDKLDTTEHEKLIMKAEIMRVQNSLELELAKLGTEMAKERASVIKAEIASAHGIAATWRPLLMLTFGLVIIYSAVISPIFGLPPADMAEIPTEFWTLVTLGVGGYIGGRSLEKIAPVVADAYKNRTDTYDS